MAKAPKTAAPRKPKKRRVLGRDERVQQLLDAAAALFANKGYHETTVDDITQKAGVAKGTFYLYFDDKRTIYREVIKRFLETIKETTGFVKTDNPNPAEYIPRAVAGARQLMTFITENQEIVRMAYREAVGLDPELSQLMSEFYREIAELEAQNIERAIEYGILRPCHPLLTAYTHIGMAERLILVVLAEPDRFPPVEKIVLELLKLGYEGIKSPSAPVLPYPPMTAADDPKR